MNMIDCNGPRACSRQALVKLESLSAHVPIAEFFARPP